VFHIEMALSAAATRARGDLSGTVCWQQVKEQINELIGTGAAAREWVLVEDLCQDVTHLIFELSPAVVQVSLEIQKQSPQPPAADFVSVKTVRSR
jgi:dihydroneopterin aldolase